MRRWVVPGAMLALITIGSLAGFLVLSAVDRFQRPGPLAADTALVVPRGADSHAIARQLAAAGVIEDALLFRLGVRYLGAARRLKAGEYAFPAAVSMREAVEILSSGETVVRRLTVPEGLTSVEVVGLVAGAEGLAGAAPAPPPEGSLLPETYHFAWADDRKALVERMERALGGVLGELWPKRDPGVPLANPAEAVILASIVEKETGVPGARPLVASVFVNRLRRGMRLQSDPTVVYGLTGGRGPLGRALTKTDLATPSPYNTYLIDGLPPGPIANPGRAALEAVLMPAKTRYLYFVANGTGGHAFAETLAAHNRNVAKWRRLQRQRNQAAQ